MSTPVDTQLRDAYQAIDETQTPLTVEEILHRAGPVAPVPIDLEPESNSWRTPLLVALAAAAAVLAVALIPSLIRSLTDEDPTTSSTTIAPTTTSPASTSTTIADALPESDGSVVVGIASDTELADLGSARVIELPFDATRAIEVGGSLYAVAEDTRVYRSDDGVSWSEVGELPAGASPYLFPSSMGGESLLATNADQVLWRSENGSEWGEWLPVDVGVRADGLVLNGASMPAGWWSLGPHVVREVSVTIDLPPEVLAEFGGQPSSFSYGTSQYLYETVGTADGSMYDFPLAEIAFTFTDDGAEVNVYRLSNLECTSRCAPPYTADRELIHTGTVKGPREIFNIEEIEAEASFNGQASVMSVPFYVGYAVSHDRGETYEIRQIPALMGDLELQQITPGGVKYHGQAVGGFFRTSTTLLKDDERFVAFVPHANGIEVVTSTTGDVWESQGLAVGLPGGSGSTNPAFPSVDNYYFRYPDDEGWVATRQVQTGERADEIVTETYRSIDAVTWEPSAPIPQGDRSGLPDPDTQSISRQPWGWFASGWSEQTNLVTSIHVATNGSDWSPIELPPGEVLGAQADASGIWIRYVPPDLDVAVVRFILVDDR